MLRRMAELGSSQQIILVPGTSHQASGRVQRLRHYASRHAEVLGFRRLGRQVLGHKAASRT